MAETFPTKAASAGTAKLIYILYLVGLAVGVTEIVGVVMAYMNKDEAPEWLKSHYHFQIRTFWISILMVFVGVILAFVIIGFFLIFFWYIWLIIRCVKGMKYIDNHQPHPNPTTWMFS